MDFSFKIVELNNNEIKLSVSKYTGSIILRKDMCLWIINTLRNASLNDYYTESKEWRTEVLEDELYCLSIETSFFVRSTPYSNVEIFPFWKDDKKDSGIVRIPYNKSVPEILMSEYIEPVLKELEKYVPAADKCKIAKPWDINAKMDEYRKQREEENKNQGKLKLNFVGEISPSELFK